MLRLVYASASSMGPKDDLIDLLSAARARNQAAGITGLLIYAHESFMQQLEGLADDVDAVFDDISRDPRHHSLRILCREPVETRRFANWSMGFEHPADDLLEQTLPGFTRSTTYPFINSQFVLNVGVADTLFGLYARTTG